MNDLELSAVGSLTLSAQAPVGTVSSTMSGRGAVSGTRSCVMASDVSVRIKLKTIQSSADGGGGETSAIPCETHQKTDRDRDQTSPSDNRQTYRQTDRQRDIRQT